MGLYVAPGSEAADTCAAIAWLWRLGPVLDAPDSDAVGLGGPEDEAELRSLVERGGLAGAALFLPGRAVEGVASFGRGARVRGSFSVLDEGTPAIRSSLGTHAVCDRRTLVVGAGPADWWGRLEYFWVLEALADFLPGVLGRPLVKLPPVGVVRIDDVPGTAQLQVKGTAKSDSEQERLVRGLASAYGRAGAVMNVAVPAEALLEGARVPIDRVWPRATAALAKGVSEGALEAVCHGLLHLVPEALERGEIDFYEFRELDRDEAGRRLDIALAWHEGALGARPPTFVAPAWGYSAGALEAASERDLPAWLRPDPRPLLDRGNLRETLNPALRGLQLFDFAPLTRLAAVGFPPSLVFHGRSLDPRPQSPWPPRHPLTLARLALHRDILRVPRIPGVRWVGAGRFAELLQAHHEAEPASPATRATPSRGSR